MTMNTDGEAWVYERELPDVDPIELHDDWHIGEPFYWPAGSRGSDADPYVPVPPALRAGALYALFSRGPGEQFVIVNRDHVGQGIHVVHLPTRIVAVAHLERVPTERQEAWLEEALERWLADPAHRTICWAGEEQG